MKWWTSLHPSVHLSIRKGRIILGNKMVEQSLVTYFAKSEAHYSIEKVNLYTNTNHSLELYM